MITSQIPFSKMTIPQIMYGVGKEAKRPEISPTTPKELVYLIRVRNASDRFHDLGLLGSNSR